MKAGTLAEPPLAGREQELEELQQCLDLVAEGKGSTVLVSGEAGSGKTRLVNEFLQSAKQKTEVTILTGICVSNAAAPYLPFVEAFDSYFSQKESQQTQNVMAEIGAWLSGAKQTVESRKYGKIDAQAWKDLTFATVTKSLFALSVNEPVILLIEDLHWADSASLSLLHFAARRLRSERILLLATFRCEELTTNAEGQTHPLAEELRLMKREGLFTEIKLPNLNQACVNEIAENMMGGKVNPELAAKLSQESRGNALFVVESLRMLSERGNLYQEHDEWHLTVDTLGIPDKFKDVILRRVSLLKFKERRVLDAASVIGEKFDVELLAVVLGQDSLEVLETLNMISRSTSLVNVEESFFRFDHAKSRQAIYEEIPLPLKRGYHSRVAEKLESAPKSGRLLFSEIAYHYAQSGNEKKAIEFALVAGQDALARFSNAEAIKHFTYVVEKVSDAPESAETKKTALEGLGDAYSANCKFTKALEVFERLAKSEVGEVKLRAYRKAMEMVVIGDFGRARLMELSRKAEPYVASDRLEGARIHLGGGNTLEDYEAAIEIFMEEYSLPDLAKALPKLGMALLSSGQYGKGVGAYLRAISLWEEIGDLHQLLDTVYLAGHFFYSSGLGEVFFQETWDLFSRAAQIGEKIGNYGIIATSRLGLGVLAEYRGRLEEAISHLLKTFEISELTDAQYTKNMRLRAVLARQYAKLGDLKRAEEFLQIAKTPPTILPSDTALDRQQAIWVIMAQAALSAANSNWKEADQYFEKCLEKAKGLPPSTKLAVRLDYAWALDKQGRNEEAKLMLEERNQILKEIEKGFVSVNVQASLMAPRLVMAGEDFEVRLDLVNVSKKAGSLVGVDSLFPPGFEVTDPPANCSLKNGYADMEGRRINPFQVVTVKLKLKTSNADTFELSPQVSYIDETGENKTCTPDPISITVQPSKPSYEILPGRISMGVEELDALLFGGIPERCAVALTSPSTDEREMIIKKFLEKGATAGEITFDITEEIAHKKVIADEYPSNFYLLVCNPQADKIVQSAPNVFKLKGVENLTDIDIALAKAFRTLNPSTACGGRICIEIVSDILLQHHAINTRRWLSALLPTLEAKGFTILGVVDPEIHPPEELKAVLSVFDGEIRVTEKESPEGTKLTIKVRKLVNQKYLESEIFLSKEKLLE